MEYLYCKNDNFKDFASGRVLYGGGGIPNFPVRLLIEIYCRAKNYLQKKQDIILYDPCCGGGYALTVLGFFYNHEIQKMYGSDIDKNMIFHAKKNVALLTDMGINRRKDEIWQLYDKYGKESHKEALHTCNRLKNMFSHDVFAEIFEADCTKTLPQIFPDIIITDVPYGNLVEWDHNELLSLDLMLEQLWMISHENTILAVCTDKKQKINCSKWQRLERQNVGKRKFEILGRVTL